MAGRSGLYCLGNALVDYEFKVDDSYIEQLGLAKGQMTLADDEVFDKAIAPLARRAEYHREGGGSAINSVITYARLGGRGGLSSIVGADDSGEFFLQELGDIGIKFHPAPSKSKQHTGRCLVLITPDHDRTMMTNLGINEQLSATAGIAERLAGFGAFYAESYLLAVPDACRFLLAHLHEARRQEMFVSLSMSDVSMVTHCRAQLTEALAGRVDLLFGNYEEFSNYTGEEDPDKIFAALPRDIKCIALTRGGDGAIIYRRGEQPLRIPAVPTQVVDTLGAGDGYAGAFLYALCERGAGYEEAAKFAARAASQLVSRMGPRLTAAECQALVAA